MRRYGNLYEKLLSKEVCTEALRKAKRHKTTRRNVKRVLKDPQYYIEAVYRLLEKGTYKTSRFHNKLIFEPKLRIIYSLPFFPDRIIHHAMMIILEPLWDSMFYKHSYACRVGKGQHRASLQCLKWCMKYRYVAQLDISQFYINCDHEILKAVVRQKIKDKRLLALLDENIDAVDVRSNNIKIYAKLLEEGNCTEQALVGYRKLLTAKAKNGGRPSGVAVGSLPSQWLGNLYLTALDRYIVETLGCKAYLRFCDDLLIFHNDKTALRQVVEKASRFLEDERRLSFSKIRIYPTTQGIDFCGYRHFPNGVILLRKRTAKRTVKRLRGLFHEIKRGFLDRERAISTIASATGWLKHAKTHNLACSMAIEDLKNEVEHYDYGLKAV